MEASVVEVGGVLEAETDVLPDITEDIIYDAISFDTSTPVFRDVQCPSYSKRRRKCQGRIVEAAVLQMVPSPEGKDDIALLKENLDCLMDFQEHAVRQILQRFTEFDGPKNERAGFLLGDGPGVGKGRIAASVIYDNILRGYPKHVYISIQGELEHDTRRDFNGIKAKDVEIHTPRSLGKNDEKIRSIPGVLYVTYHTLVSEPRKYGKQRNHGDVITDMFILIDKFVNGLQGFEGVIVCDESHFGKNALHEEKHKQSRVGQMILELQARCPNAQFLFCSATIASIPRHLAYLERMGMWGSDLYFKDFESFNACMRHRELSAMEILALKWKEKGAFLSRQLSLQDVNFEVFETPLSDEFQTLYNLCGSMWSQLYSHICEILDLYAADRDVRKKRLSAFWSGHLQFFKCLIISSKLEFTIERVKRAILAGHCVIIGLQSTGESALKNKDLVNDDFVSTARSIWENVVSECIPAESVDTVHVRVEDNESVEGPRPKRRRADPISDKRNYWFSSIAKLKLPGCFLDDLTYRLESLESPRIKISELTGRKKKQVVKVDPLTNQKTYHIEDRHSSEVDHTSYNLAQKEDFMKGICNVAIISEAASTGISLHCDRSKKYKSNRKKRVHITVEFNWSSERQRQQLGRSHRSNQKFPPEYEFIVAKVPGERRFTSTISKRLRSMGAITNADRRTTIKELNQYHIDDSYGKKAITSCLEFIGGKRPSLESGWIVSESDKTNLQSHFSGLRVELYNVPQLDNLLKKTWNRLLGCELHLQQIFLNMFTCERLWHQMQRKENCGVKFFDDQYVLRLIQKLYLKKNCHGVNTPHEDIILAYFSVTCGSMYDEILGLDIKTDHAVDKLSGFYLQNQMPLMISKQICYLENMLLSPQDMTKLAQGESVNELEYGTEIVACKYGPSEKPEKLRLVELVNFLGEYSQEKNDFVVQDTWDKQTEDTTRACVHTYNYGCCKGGLDCKKGLRSWTEIVLTGDVLAAWEELCTTLNTTDFNIAVGKVKTAGEDDNEDEQERYFYGIHIPARFDGPLMGMFDVSLDEVVDDDV